MEIFGYIYITASSIIVFLIYLFLILYADPDKRKTWVAYTNGYLPAVLTLFLVVIGLLAHLCDGTGRFIFLVMTELIVTYGLSLGFACAFLCEANYCQRIFHKQPKQEPKSDWKAREKSIKARSRRTMEKN